MDNPVRGVLQFKTKLTTAERSNADNVIFLPVRRPADGPVAVTPAGIDDAPPVHLTAERDHQRRNALWFQGDFLLGQGRHGSRHRSALGRNH